MDTLEKAELTASIRHIARFLKSGIQICNFEVIPDTTERKTRRRKRGTPATAKRFAFHANTKSKKLSNAKNSKKGKTRFANFANPLVVISI